VVLSNLEQALEIRFVRSLDGLFLLHYESVAFERVGNTLLLQIALISECNCAWRMVVVNKLCPGPKQKEPTEHMTARHPHKYEFKVLESIIRFAACEWLAQAHVPVPRHGTSAEGNHGANDNQSKPSTYSMYIQPLFHSHFSQLATSPPHRLLYMRLGLHQVHSHSVHLYSICFGSTSSPLRL
jgi:hypothetical protein